MTKNKGFTLIEILIALALMGLVTTAIYQLYISQYKTWVSQDMVTEMQQSGRFAIDTITREAQLAGYNLDPDLSGTSEKAVMEATASRFTFISTDTSLSEVTKRTRKISFYYDSANKRLKMDVTTWDNTGAGSYGSTDTNTLAENVTALSYDYYDDQGNITAVIDDIRRVKITITVQTSRKDPVTGDYKSMTLVTEIRPRNLGIGESFTDSTAPATPTGVQIIDTGECSKLTLKWNANTEIDLSGYTIYYSTTSNSNYQTIKVATSAYNSYELTGLTTTSSTDATATTYYIRLDAYDAYGNSSTWTGEYSGSPSPNIRAFGTGTNDTTINISKAPAPTNFTGPGDGGNNEVHLTWDYDSAANPQVTGFRIYRSTSPFTTYPIAVGGNITLIAGVSGDLVTILSSTDRQFTDTDSSLLGCVKYYYAIAAVPCDTTLMSNDTGDNDTKRYIQTDYASTCGDGTAACSPGTGFPSTTGSDTAPSDNGSPPAPTIVPAAGWKAVFLKITNPVLSGDPAVDPVAPDFSHTVIYFNEGGTCPTVDITSGSPTYGDISNGFALPNSDSGVRGQFTTTGVVPPVTHLDDDCVFENCSDKTLNGTIRNLENASTYCYLGVAYDTCGNATPIANTVTTLTELCGDDPAGAPGNGTMSGEVWPTGATPVSVTGCQASDGLDISWDSMNHTYPDGYFDGAFYRVHMKTGDSDFSAINPNDAVTLKTFEQAELSVMTSFSSGPIVSGVSDGESYYFGITATDCVFENNYASFQLNYSDWLTKGPITPGELKRDEKINGARNLHREILTGVTIDNSDGNGSGATSPSSSFRHNTVMMFLENTSAGNMTIEKATVQWVNSLAYLREVSVGGGFSGKSRQTTSVAQAASLTITESPYTRKVTDYAITGGTIPGLARHVPISFTFKDSAGNDGIDMRGDQLKITLSVKNESTGTITCVSYLTTTSPQTVGDIAIPTGPSVTTVQQDKPTAPTDAFAVPGGGETANSVPTNGTDYANLKVIGAGDIDVTTFVDSGTTDADTGNKLDISGVKLYWTQTGRDKDQDDVASISLSDWTPVDMTNPFGNEWRGTIVNPTAGNRVWYFIVATDSDGNYDRAPEINEGFYTFDMKSFDPCSVTPSSPTQLVFQAPYADSLDTFISVTWPKITTYTNGSNIVAGDTIKYLVYRRNTATGSFTKLYEVPHSESSDIWKSDPPEIAPSTGSWYRCNANDCDWWDYVNLLNTANDLTYYVVAQNSCNDAADLNISSQTNYYRECRGATSAVIGATSPITAGDSYTVTVNDCTLASQAPYNTQVDTITLGNISNNGAINLPVTLTETSASSGVFSGTVGSTWLIGEAATKVFVSSGDTSPDTITVSCTTGCSGTPSAATVTVNAAACENTPEPPTGLAGVAGGSGSNQYIRLTWTASTSFDRAAYKIYRKDIIRNAQGQITQTIDFREVAQVAFGTLTYDNVLGSTDISRNDYWYYLKTIDSCSTPKESAASTTVGGASGF